MTETQALEFAILALREAHEAAIDAANKPIDFIEYLKVAPSLLVVGIAAFFLIYYFKTIEQMIGRITGVSALGVSVDLQAQKALEVAVREFDGLRVIKTYSGDTARVHVSSDDRTRVLKRAASCVDVLKQRQILWIDDNPGNNRHEIDLFGNFEIQTHVVATEKEAFEALLDQNVEYDVVLSDMKRGNIEDAGMKFLSALRQKDTKLPVIFYFSNLDRSLPVPATAFGMTNRPDELFHLLMDALERQRPLV